MTFHLPARWRREAAELERLALQRDDECREDAAHRLLARADTWRLAATELQEELDQPTDPVHNAPDDPGGTAHAQDSPDHHPPR